MLFSRKPHKKDTEKGGRACPSQLKGRQSRLPQDPLVEQLKPDPTQPAKRVVVLIALPGDSDRSGYQRLYLPTKLDYFAEFLASDIASTESVPAAQSPFPGLEATRAMAASNPG